MGEVTVTWTLEATRKELGGVSTARDPGRWRGKESHYVPVLRVSGARATVTVPCSHEDWVEYIWVKDQGGKVVAVSKLKPTDAAKLEFIVPPGTTSLTGFECCNLRGV